MRNNSNTKQPKSSSIRPYWIMYMVFFGLLALGQLQRFSLTPTVAIYGHEVLLIAWLLLYVRPVYLQTKQLLFQMNKRFPLSMFLLFFVIFQTLIWQMIQPDFISLLYLARLVLYLFLMPLLLIGIEAKEFTSKTVTRTLITVGTVIALAGVAQYLLIPDTRFLWYAGWDDHYYRLISTLFDPNFTALILVLTFLIILAHRTLFERWQYVAYLILFPLTILLTYSRAGFLSFLIGTVAWIVLQKQWKLLLLIVIFVTAIPLLPRPGGEGVKLERTASIVSRVESNQTAVAEVRGLEWFVGQGLYRERSASENSLPNHATTPDNSLIFIFTSLGIIGVVLLGITAGQILAYHHHPLLVSMLLAATTHSMFNNSLFYIWVMVFLIGAVVITTRLRTK